MKYLLMLLTPLLFLAACQNTLFPPIAAQQDNPTSQPITPTPESTQASDSIGDVYYPQLGNGGYDTLHYLIDLTVDMANDTINGNVTIEAQATANLASFNLDFQGFTITNITVNNEPASYQRDEPELTITPANSLDEGDAFTVEVIYNGEPRPIMPDAISILNGWNRYNNGVYVMNEPEGAAAIYPNNNHPLDKATHTFRITVPKPYVVVANGQLQDTIDNGTTTTYVWEARDLMASYLMTLGITDYVVQAETGPNNLPIRNYFPREIADEAEEAFAPTSDMLVFFNEIFGPYPFEAYGVVVADTDLSFALETQTISLFGRNAATTNPENIEPVVAHELAHQWFGNSVSLEQWKDIWLNEGFATYASWLWLEHIEGSEALAETVQRTHATLRENYSTLPPPGNPPSDNLFNPNVYQRGALTLHVLRLRVGDEAFFDILRTYTEQYEYSNASTDDFITVAEEVSGQELDDLFEAWLYVQPLPKLPSQTETHLPLITR